VALIFCPTSVSPLSQWFFPPLEILRSDISGLHPEKLPEQIIHVRGKCPIQRGTCLKKKAITILGFDFKPFICNNI
jgi:hypothetical protein